MMASTTDTSATLEERTTEPKQQMEQELEQQRQNKRKRSENDCDGPNELAVEESSRTKKDSSSSSSSSSSSAAAHGDGYHDTDDIAILNSIRNEYQGFSFQHPHQHEHRFPPKGESSAQKRSVDDDSRSDDSHHERAVVDCIKIGSQSSSISPSSPSSSTTTTTTNLMSMTAKDFFDKYIATRKPCIIKGYDKISITVDDLSRVAGTEMVQVERRFSSTENFGQNRTASRQIIMTIDGFLQKLNSSDDDDDDDGKNNHGSDIGELFYLSTQQPDTDDSQSGDDYKLTKEGQKGDDSSSPLFMIHAFRTAPCQQLFDAKLIPPTLPWAGNLKLESCNCWCGNSTDGSSSGLHHDYHDNFYILQQGKKQFEIFSPDTAPYMRTFGEIDQIYFNGVISYKGSETRPDGVPIKTDPDDGDGADDEDNNDKGRGDAVAGQEDEDGEEEFVIGKGFDYEDSDEDEENYHADYHSDGHDDFNEIFHSEDKEAGEGERMKTDARPNSFSRIDLNSSEGREHIQKHKLKRVTVTLEKGDVLFLPAGFFHCVTSFSPDDRDSEKADAKKTKKAMSSAHMAINYWYHPPDRLDSFESPYTNPGDLP